MHLGQTDIRRHWPARSELASDERDVFGRLSLLRRGCPSFEQAGQGEGGAEQAGGAQAKQVAPRDAVTERSRVVHPHAPQHGSWSEPAVILSRTARHLNPISA